MVSACSANMNTLNESALRSRIKQQDARSEVTHQPFPQQAAVAVETQSPQAYRLGPADVVRITVANKEQLDSTQAVRPDGKIAFFPAGDIVAAGRTVEELREELTNRLTSKPNGPYRLGPQDVVAITVYEHDDLAVTQAVSPDGTLSVMDGKPIHVAGKTLDQARVLIRERIARMVQDPLVNVYILEYGSQPLLMANPVINVVVQEFNSRRAAVLGSVQQPGILQIRTPLDLFGAISEAGGLSEFADLSKSIVVREGAVLPVSLDRLFRHRDISQNIQIQPGDVIFISSTQFNRAYVIGQVNNPGTISWAGSLRLTEAVALAGGYKTDAKANEILVIKDGPVEPTLHLVDAASVLRKGDLANNMPLESGDIVFVPQTGLATAERYLQAALNVLQPILALESAIILGDSASSVLQGDGPTVGTSIDLNP